MRTQTTTKHELGVPEDLKAEDRASNNPREAYVVRIPS